MIIVIALLFFFRQYGTSAAPVVATSSLAPFAYGPTLFARDDASGPGPSRSVWDIVWSCLATTFAVTWVSVHPNVPFLEESSWHALKRRIFLMCLALLAPEVMVMWAFKQWRGAAKIKGTINEARPRSCTTEWTMTHAHFLQMGGFKLKSLQDETYWNYTGDMYSTTQNGITVEESCIKFEQLRDLLQIPLIDFSETLEKEMEDRSKSDTLSMGVALLQISWFILQLIARAHQHLAITEIELTTAALAGLNSVMYLFWWSKPFNVRCPIVIRTKALERRLAEMENEEGNAGKTKWSSPEEDDESVSRKVDLLAFAARCIARARNGAIGCLHRAIHWPQSLYKAIRAAQNNTEKTANHRSTGQIQILSYCKSAVTRLLYLPYVIMFLSTDAVLGDKGDPHGTRQKDAKQRMDNATSLHLLFTEHDIRWIMSMMFYSEQADTKLLLIFSAVAGAIFGSIHCAAWNSSFPSTVEQVLWRTASLAIIGVCLCIVAGIPLYSMIERRREGAALKAYRRYTADQALPFNKRRGVKHGDEDARYRMWWFVQRFTETIPAIICPLARFSLLALALSSLRDLPKSALETVTWTKFIPHI